MNKFAFKGESSFKQAITVGIFILLVLGSFYSSISSTIFAIQSNTGSPGEDMVSSWEKRLRKARLLLPNSGVVGYVADWDLPEKQFGSKDQEIEFLLTQYTLAPLIFARGTDQNIVVGNFNDTGDPDRLKNISSTLGIDLETVYSNEFFIFKGSTR